MTFKILRLKIDELHGNLNYDIRFNDNKLVLVGENGTGKSTVSTILYYILTAQWRKIQQFKFKSILVNIDGVEFSFNNKDITNLTESSVSLSRILHSIPLRQRQALEEIVQLRGVDFLLQDRTVLIDISNSTGIPVDYLIHELHYAIHRGPERSGTQSKKLNNKFREISKKISGQILFLPTYRRIEQDLKTILPRLEKGLENYKHSLSRKSREANYVELVEFGMEDVEETIHHQLEKLKDNSRSGLSELTGSYLREVLRGIHRDVNVNKFSELTLDVIDEIVGRIDEKMLPSEEKKTLLDTIHQLRQRGDVQDDEKVAAHFFSKLVDLYVVQSGLEKPILDFASVCNKYLSGKKISFTPANFSLKIIPDDNRDEVERLNSPLDAIPMRALSSGEKQIVSLFSHIYLSGNQSFFLIIDEPELSLSVPWQRRFLPDLVNTGRCNGLVAVTHSPFVFENSLKTNTHSLREFIGIE